MTTYLQKAFLIITIFCLFIISDINAQSKGFGLGVMLGQPTGISAKLWLSKTSAIAAGGAWNFKNKALQVQVDYLHHFNDVFPITVGKMPVYAGVGASINFKNDGTEPDYGIRLPVGISYYLPISNVDVYVEAVPIIIIKPVSRVGLNGNIGVRYFF
ncbi:hypothetical protein BH10BAC5_BH10BAC5_25220 [soil metagenome]